MYFWKTITKTLLIILAPVVLIITIQLLGPQFKQERELRETRNELRRETGDLETSIAKLRENIERFSSEPAFVERTANEMGMVRENEVVFKFED